jgi:ribosomal protein L4
VQQPKQVRFWARDPKRWPRTQKTDRIPQENWLGPKSWSNSSRKLTRTKKLIEFLKKIDWDQKTDRILQEIWLGPKNWSNSSKNLRRLKKLIEFFKKTD